MKESEVKAYMVRQVKEGGGYARRLEDRFGLGIPDLLLIPKDCPVMMAEVKIVVGNTFHPTDRQFIELCRINATKSPHAFGIMIGWRNGVAYFSEPAKKIDIRECFSITTHDVPFHEQLAKFYHARLRK